MHIIGHLVVAHGMEMRCTSVLYIYIHSKRLKKFTHSVLRFQFQFHTKGLIQLQQIVSFTHCQFQFHTNKIIQAFSFTFFYAFSFTLSDSLFHTFGLDHSDLQSDKNFHGRIVFWSIVAV